ncbi:MAG: phosphatidate cytidylyltransferase [bacterium]
MKSRIYSALALVLVLTATLALDRASGTGWFSAALIAAVLSMGAVECHTLLRLQGRRPTGVGRALLAAGGIGLPGAFLLALRLQEDGLLLVLYLIAVAKMTDNGALFAGRLWGRHKLAPKISPAKTIEGVCGGLAIGVLTAVLLGPCCTSGRPGFFLLFGVTVSLLAVLGDLAESWVKRKAGVKDSGSVLPGIGGILDLMDSVLLSAPAGYLLLALR